MQLRANRGLISAAVCVVVSGCGALGGDPTIQGEIRDAQIVLNETSGPQSVWLELTHVGTTPCELAAALADDPDQLPIVDGRVPLSHADTGSGAAHAMLGYVEVDGQPMGGEGTTTGVTVQPGSTVRMQLALTGTPDTGERVVLCNGPGDFEAGRYAVLTFER